ncbi:MAG: S-layer homology domain-containing protein [Candidatus Gracilibacteria bacterium]|nr:S-layer homology domain-containing protein [Candidatus Gracilibacteria bacterium]
MNTFIIRKLKKAVSGITVFTLFFSILNPWGNLVNATIDTIGNSVMGLNNGYINLANSGSYNVSFDFSGTLDAGDIINIDVIDGSGNIASGSTIAVGSETGITINGIDTSSLVDGEITLSGSVFSGSTETASGINATIDKDTIAPEVTVTNTGNVNISNSGSYVIVGTSTEGIHMPSNIIFSGSTQTGAEMWLGATSFTGTVDLSQFDDGLITYKITPYDIAGNTGTIVVGTVTKNTNLVSGSISTASGSFVSLTGSISLSNLDIGGIYMLMSGSTVVSSGALVATTSTGQINLNPSFFTNFGYHALTLSGAKDLSTVNNLDTKSFYIGPMDFGTFFPSLGSTLSASGIVNNLSGVTNSNVQNYTGLYFEKTGYGKVLFGSGLNLTNSGTQTFLKDLPNKLDMTDGYINFDPTSSDFANYGAQLSMYFDTGSTFVAGLNNPSNFVVKSNTETVIDSSTVLSNIHGACGVGEPYCTLFFDTAHFTNFDLKPVLTTVKTKSNNTYSGALAKIGDIVSLSFSGSEALTGVTVSFAGIPAAQIQGGGDSWIATSTPINSGNTNGQIAFTIDYSDMNSNTGSTATGTTDGSIVTIDKVSPTATIGYSTTGAINGDVVATLTGTSETITITNNGGLNSYTFTGNTNFTFQFRDGAGNTGSTIATVNWINKTAPVITLNGSGTTNVEFGSNYTELGANWSDLTDGTGVVSTISGTVNTGALGTYSVKYVYVNSLGNTGSIIRTVNVADTVSPTATVQYSPATLTKNNVTATLTGASETITGTLDHTFTTNGTYTFIFHDLVGNTGSVLSTVDWIDKAGPVISAKNTSDLTQTGATVNFNFTDKNFSTGTGYVVVYTGSNIANLVETGVTTLIFSSGSGNGNSVFDNLLTSTGYEYLINLTDNLGNITSSTGAFSTPTIITLTGGTNSETGATALTGATIASGNTFDLGGTNISIESDSTDDNYITGSLIISGTNIVVSSGSWNGILLPPTIIDNTSSNAATGSEIGTGITVAQTIKVGAENSSLTSTGGGYFNVSFAVPGYSSGTVFDLYRSNDGINWTRVSPDSSCILDAGLNCSFRTDHLTSFAPVIDSTPNAFSFTAQTNAETSNDYAVTTTVAGINTGTTISISGAGTYKINNSAYTGSAGTVNNGDVVMVKLTSSSSYSTLVSTTLDIGGVTAQFSITTKVQSGSSGGGGWANNSSNVTTSTGTIASTGAIMTSTGTTDTNIITTGNDENSTATPTGVTDNTTTTTETTGVVTFNDINNSFATNYIKALVKLNVISGYSDGTFRPENSATRAEFLKMVLKSFNIGVDENATTDFTDIPADGAWMIKYIAKAKELGIISGQTIDGKLVFKPSNGITRAEVAKIIVKVMLVLKKK